MEFVAQLWKFFVETHNWYWNLWNGWFGFFGSIIPWYLGLKLGQQIGLGLLYVSGGIIFVEQTGGVTYKSPSNNPTIRKIQQAMYKLYVAILWPALFVVATMIVIPWIPGFFFYGIWLIVWCFVAMIGLIVLVFAWPISLFFR